MGACEKKETAAKYNKRVKKAIAFLNESLPTFAVVDEGIETGEKSCILVEKGKFYGMGYLQADAELNDLDYLKKQLVQYPENDYIRGLIYSYVDKQPEKKLVFG